MRILPHSRQWDSLRSTPLGRAFPRRVAITGGSGLPTEVELPTPLTLVFGLNGVGKTRLLGEIAASLEHGTLVSVHELLNYLIKEFGQRADIADLLEETSPLEINTDHLSSISDIVRRDYEEVRWYVVPIIDSPFASIVGEEVVPVFVVRYAGVEYDFRRMGLGELSTHLLMWLLSYTREDADVPLLFDEPEAFLPPPSRGVVLAHLLENVIRRGAPIVVASHSMELIQHALDANSALLMLETANGLTILGPQSAELNDAVSGLYERKPPVRWLFLCEDESAYILVQELLRHLDADILRSASFLWCRGYGDLEDIWKHLPRPPVLPDALIKFAFIADGDKAVSVAEAHDAARTEVKRRWPFLCLPDDPDLLMKQASEHYAELLSEGLGMAPGILSGMLSRLRGREAHNWVEDVLKESGVERQAGLRVLARAVVKVLVQNGGIDVFRDALAAKDIS